MANLDIRVGKKNAAFFAANPTLVLKDGQLIYNEDTGDLFIGDGVTQLSALVAINGGSASVWGAITGTLSNQTDLQNALNAKINTSDIGVTVQAYSANTTLLGNSTTGSGSIVLATSPTIQTSLNISAGGSGTLIRDIVGVSTLPAIYLNQASPSNSNYTLAAISTSAIRLNAPAGGSLNLSIGTANYATLTSGYWEFTPINLGSANIRPFTITIPAQVGGNKGAGQNIPMFQITGNTSTWAAGTLSTQYFNHFTANTVAFASASTATMPVNLYVEAPLAGANCTATNLAAIGCGGHLFIANSVGVPSNNPTDGGLLYVEAGALKYRGSSGTVTTIASA